MAEFGVSLTDWHVAREDGDGTTLYFGQRAGARYVGINLRGFSGWSSSKRMPGGWEFFNPGVHVGRLFMDAHRLWSRKVLLPAGLVHLWRLRRRAYRHPHGEPLRATRAQNGSGDRS